MARAQEQWLKSASSHRRSALARDALRGRSRRWLVALAVALCALAPRPSAAESVGPLIGMLEHRGPGPWRSGPAFTPKEVAGWEALSEFGWSVLVPSPRAPRCEDVFVYIVASSVGGGRASATLSISERGRGTVYRVGGRLGPYLVIAIGDNKERFSPAVWLARDGEVCQALLRDENPTRDSAVRAARAQRAKQYAKSLKRRTSRAAARSKRKKKSRRKARRRKKR